MVWFYEMASTLCIDRYILEKEVFIYTHFLFQKWYQIYPKISFGNKRNFRSFLEIKIAP